MKATKTKAYRIKITNRQQKPKLEKEKKHQSPVAFLPVIEACNQLLAFACQAEHPNIEKETWRKNYHKLLNKKKKKKKPQYYNQNKSSESYFDQERDIVVAALEKQNPGQHRTLKHDR